MFVSAAFNYLPRTVGVCGCAAMCAAFGIKGEKKERRFLLFFPFSRAPAPTGSICQCPSALQLCAGTTAGAQASGRNRLGGGGGDGGWRWWRGRMRRGRLRVNDPEQTRSGNYNTDGSRSFFH